MRRARLHQEIVRRLLLTGAHHRLERVIDKLHPADIAELIGGLGPGEFRSLVDVLLGTKRAERTLRELPEALLADLLEHLDDARLTLIISRLPPDDACRLLSLMPEHRRQAVVERVPPEQRAELNRILKYAPGTAGAMMTPRVLTVNEAATADSAISQMRRLGDTIEEVSSLYVVDDEGRLRGVVPLRRLVAAPPEKVIGQLMIEDPVTVSAHADQEEVARLVSKYNLLAIPVLDDDEGKLLGVITVDDVIDVIHEEATEDMYHMAGLPEDERVFSPFGRAVSRRVPWAIASVAAALVAAAVVGLFQGSIASLVVLAVFMPVVASLGGNMGIQTLTLITRGLALGELEFSSALRVVMKEVGVGFVGGALAGLLAGGVAYLWLGNTAMGLVIFAAMIANMALAGLAGAVIPLSLKALGQDPALGGGVIVTTLTDVFGFGCFLGLATIFMRYLL